MAADIATIPADQFTPDKIELIKRTICVGATDDELALFIGQCRRTGLDPFAKQIHAVKRWNSEKNCYVMAIQTAIDGYRLIAERTGKYAGNDDPVFDREDGEHPNKATATVWKIVDGQRVPFTRSARWNEFVQTKKDGSATKFWKSMPYLMLGKCAEALALRAAFPQDLAGIYTHEEMGQADSRPLARNGEHVNEATGDVTEDPSDKPLVDDYLSLMGECSNGAELQDIGAKIGADVKLTAAGKAHLRERYTYLAKRLPKTRTVAREPGDDTDEIAREASGAVAR